MVRRLGVRRALPFLALVISVPLAVRGLAFWHGRGAGPLYDGELETQRELARGVDRWVEADLGRADFATGDPRFDGEWLFATRMMAVLGNAQIALAHPELREESARRIDRCLAALTAPEARTFDREAWGADAIDDLGSERAHMGYLGYLALALALARLVDPDTRFAELEARVIDHLSALYASSELGLLETYPGEIYPTDNSAFFGALGVHDRATGEDHRALRRAASAALERNRDRASGLLHQSVHAGTGAPVDLPRGSGTALAAYFVSFSDTSLSRSLFDSIRGHLSRSLLGFGSVREYLPGEGGFGDVDSGPVVFGQGVSVTGFTLALARVHGDRELFERIYATTALVGGPVGDDGTHYALGGPIGDALLFALTTALPASEWVEPER